MPPVPVPILPQGRQAPDPQAPDPQSDDEIIRRGEEAIHAVRQTFDRWMDIARALDIGRQIALAETHANNTDDRSYRKAFGRWLDRHPAFKDPRVLPQSTRKWLLNCYDNLAEITAWRAARGADEAVRYTFPEIVFKRWARAERPDLLITTPGQGRPREPGRAPGESLRDRATRLEQELQAANARIRRLESDEDRGPLITRTDSADAIARVIFEWLPASKQNRVIGKLMQMLNPTASRPASRRIIRRNAAAANADASGDDDA